MYSWVWARAALGQFLALDKVRRGPTLFFVQQERHCMYDVTLRRVRATYVAVEKQ
jgi:hypothetical protein